jgi:hypothetical protein
MAANNPLAFLLRPASLLPLLTLLAAPLAATNYSLTVTTDAVAADGFCSLREAIRAATTNAAVNECAAGGADDLIALASGLPFSFGQGQEIIDGGGVLTFLGLPPGEETTVIDLQGQNRFLRIESGATVTLERVTIQNGDAMLETELSGGALYVTDANLTLLDSEIRDSVAVNGGGLYFEATGNQRLVVEESRLIENRALGNGTLPTPSGGGIALVLRAQSAARISGAEFRDNEAFSDFPSQGAQSGGLHAFVEDQALLEVIGGEFTGNVAQGTLFGDFGAAYIASVEGTSDNPRVLVSDVAFNGNGLANADASGFTTGLRVEAASDSIVTLRRLRLFGNPPDPSAGTHMFVTATEQSQVEINNVLVAAGPAIGLDVVTANSANLLMGHITVASHAVTGLRFRADSIGTNRLENSLLYGNGLDGGPDDIDTVSTSPSVDQTTNHNWIGELGDPDPLFVGPLDFHLQPSSGAVDAGDQTFASVGLLDADHRVRVDGPETDLGAFEVQLGGLFADDFESGDLRFWSASSP